MKLSCSTSVHWASKHHQLLRKVNSSNTTILFKLALRKTSRNKQRKKPAPMTMAAASELARDDKDKANCTWARWQKAINLVLLQTPQTMWSEMQPNCSSTTLNCKQTYTMDSSALRSDSPNSHFYTQIQLQIPKFKGLRWFYNVLLLVERQTACGADVSKKGQRCTQKCVSCFKHQRVALRGQKSFFWQQQQLETQFWDDNNNNLTIYDSIEWTLKGLHLESKQRHCRTVCHMSPLCCNHYF